MLIVNLIGLRNAYKISKAHIWGYLLRVHLERRDSDLISVWITDRSWYDESKVGGGDLGGRVGPWGCILQGYLLLWLLTVFLLWFPPFMRWAASLFTTYPCNHDALPKSVGPMTGRGWWWCGGGAVILIKLHTKITSSVKVFFFRFPPPPPTIIQE